MRATIGWNSNFRNHSSFPCSALWTISKLNAQASCRAGKEIFKLTNYSSNYHRNVRKYTLKFIEDSYFKIEDDECIREYKELNLNTDEVKVIDKILYQNEISRIKDKKKMWEMVWGNLNIDKQRYLATSENWSKYGYACLLVKKVNDKVELDSILQMIEKRYASLEKVFFSFCSLFFCKQSIIF